MKRALLTAGAVLILTAPAFAQSSVTIEKKTTITKEPAESGSTISTEIIAPNPPPAPQAEVPPPPPGPGVTWVSGHWSWSPDTHAYVWIKGKYLEPPRPRAAWIPGRFVQRPNGWIWEEGRWD